MVNICDTGHNQFNEIVKVLNVLKNEVIQNTLLNQDIPFSKLLQQKILTKQALLRNIFS